jgi:hypothetical protein
MVFAVNANTDPNSNKTYDDYLGNALDTANSTKSGALGLRMGAKLNLKGFWATVVGMALAGMLV